MTELNGKLNLSRKQIEVITETAAQEAIKAYEKKNKESTTVGYRDWRLRNTKLLLKNYQLLFNHCSEIVDELDGYENVIFDPDELNLQTLMKYKARTKKMLDYFDNVWEAYHRYCIQKGSNVYRRFKVLDRLYILESESKLIDIADYYGVDERTIRRDERKATEELSVFLFGIDSLDELSNVLFVS